MQFSEAHAAFRGTRHFGSLDGVRCVSILAVLWHHTDHTWVQMAWAGRGFLGVDMFFVLSGFLIVTLILREKEKSGTVSLRNFYLRRTLRIFPIYYALILTLAVAYALLKAGDPDTRRLLDNLPLYLLYLSNFAPTHANNLGHTWSLATEEQFYLIWPALERFVRGRAIFVLLGAVLLLNQVINFGLLDPLIDRYYAHEHHPEVFDATFTPIALGVLLAHLLHRPAYFSWVYRMVGTRSACLVCGGLLLFMIAVSPPDVSGVPRLTIQVLMALFLASLVVREDHVLAPALSLKPIVRIGTVSYGMYLYHMHVRHAVLAALSKVGLERVPALDFILVTVATWLVAEVSFRLFEQWFLRLKKRFGGT